MNEKLSYAIQCHQQGDLNQALNIYQEIVSKEPQHADAWQFLGVISMQTGKLDQAIDLIKKAIAIRSDIPGYHSNLAMAYKEIDQFNQSLTHYQHAISLSPENPVLHFNLAALFHHYGRFEEARNAYVASLQLKPDQPLVHHNLGNLLLKQGDVKGALMAASIAKKLAPENQAIQSNYLFCLNYSVDYPPEVILNEHLKWGRQYPETDSQTMNLLHNQRIHIGYVSPDFRNHAVTRFVQAILTYHDVQQFNIFCYSNVKKADRVTNLLKQLNVTWRDIYGQNDDDVIQQIQSDNIHILVDLAGHSSNNRLTVFARKAAPVQMTYLGYPNTTGLSQIHFRIIDYWTDPDLNQFAGSEKRLYLPHGFLCFTPMEFMPSISSASPKKTVTFGSFNNLPKVNKHVIQLWASVLKATPHSRLLLKTKGFNDIAIQNRYLDKFERQGINPDRIQLSGSIPDETAHLEMYNHVDIALDTFPYNGTTTTCEALFMGVPVITLAGTYHASRVGVSILSQIGLSEWIAYHPNEFIQKSVHLAERSEDRQYIRKHLRKRLLQSDLCQGKKFVRSLESLYLRLFK